MKLRWDDYKSSEGSRCVRFPGGFCLYVICTDNNWNKTDRWRVWWSDNEPKIKGLNDVWFKSLKEAQLAAEAVFVPMVQIARQLVKVAVSVDVSAGEALLGSGREPEESKPRRKR